ncbi:hypothetical protein QJS66_02135 [Kocuria rhizophila]|nr:hypothetical protein QJS66_02135 [Kocuria rhizophila]
MLAGEALVTAEDPCQRISRFREVAPGTGRVPEEGTPSAAGDTPPRRPPAPTPPTPVRCATRQVPLPAGGFGGRCGCRVPGGGA